MYMLSLCYTIGGQKKNWKQRYVVLSHQYICYYEPNPQVSLCDLTSGYITLHGFIYLYTTYIYI